jgi:DNA-directed RNA polymerase subunit M/transcription elongation factor TFIIS
MSSNIRFCSKCDNKYYHRILGNQLIYNCRVCGNTEQNVSNQALCVLDTQFQQGTQNFDFIVNKYTKFDPTLPHLFVHCPNDQCKTNAGNNNIDSTTDAIYLRYDNNQMKFLYICTECDYKWKTD